MKMLASAYHILVRLGLLNRAPPRKKRLIIDVSVIYKGDVHTGIQRVVRGVLSNISVVLSDDVEIVFAAASARHSYRQVPLDFLNTQSRIKLKKLPKLPFPEEGDVFLALDLNLHSQPRHKKALLRWQRNGCRIAVVIYDLLPVYHPEWFSENLVTHFRQWISLHAQHADQFLCISRWVAEETTRYIRESRVERKVAPEISSFVLGADLANSVPTKGLSQRDYQVLALTARTPTVLCVGTIEPRKGHADVLNAFVQQAHLPDAWSLVIVGRAGWKTDELQQRMREIAALHHNFAWLDSATDEMLESLYCSAKGLVAASLDEGFGLPIIEALARAVPVLARDIPVFRELACRGVEYFSQAGPEDLANAIKLFVSNPPRVAAKDLLEQATWPVCAHTIASHLRLSVQS